MDFPDEPQLPSAAPVAPVPEAAKLPVAPVAPAPVATAPAPTAPAAPAAPVAAVPPAAAAATVSTEARPVTAESILEAIAKDGPGFIEALTPQFAVSPELALELEADYAAAVPKLLANVYMKSIATAVDYINKLVPAMIDRHAAQQRLHTDAETEFFGKFKGLNRAAHGADIIALAKAFTAANPKMDKQSLFDLVGAAVMAKHGIVGNTAPPASAPAARPAGFTPAGSGPVVVSQTQVSDNLFEGMGRDYE